PVAGKSFTIVVKRIDNTILVSFFFLSCRRRHTRFTRDWSSDVCSSDLPSTWRSALADTSPLIETSVPMTEKVAPPLAMGLLGLEIGRASCGKSAERGRRGDISKVRTRFRDGQRSQTTGISWLTIH